MSITASNTPVAENIVRIIAEKRLVQSKMALDAGLTVQTFNDMINGRRLIKANNIPQIAKALHVEPNALFGIEAKGREGERIL